MNRILIVEDDDQRCAWFHREFALYERDATPYVAVAVEWLREREYSLIFLDHDLVDEHYGLEMADDGLTGYVVAAWLALHPDQQPDAQIIIHSLNYMGAQRMLDVLENAGRKAEHVPFHALPSLF